MRCYKTVQPFSPSIESLCHHLFLCNKSLIETLQSLVHILVPISIVRISFPDKSIDNTDMTTQHSRDDASNGWLLSSTSTTVISRRQLPTIETDTVLKKRMATPAHLAGDQKRLSAGSGNSTPGMTEGSSGSESDVSVEDEHNLLAEHLLWNSYFENGKTYGFNTYSGPPSRSCTPRTDRSKTTPTRQRSPLSRSARLHASPQAIFKRSPLASPFLRPEYAALKTYSPFPPTSRSASTTPSRCPSPLHAPSKSWPLRIESRQAHPSSHIQTQTQARPPMRPRAQTSPSPSDIQRLRAQAPASLKLCTTSRVVLTPPTGTLQMQSRFAPQEFMDGMGSYLDIDDEDEEGDEKGVLGGLVGRLKIKKCALDDNDEGKGLKESLRKISSEVRDVFRMKR